MLRTKDLHGSGIAWIGMPHGVVKHQDGSRGLRIGVWVAPRLYGDASNGTQTTKDMIETLFKDWPSMLRASASDFKVRFLTPEAPEADLGLFTSSATLVGVSPAQGENWSEAWNILFTGSGPFGDRTADHAQSVKATIRVTPLAPDLIHADVRADGTWLRKAYPAATTTYPAATMMRYSRELRRAAHQELFALRSVSYGPNGKRLNTVGLEAWGLPLRTQQYGGAPVNFDHGQGANTLKDLSDVGQTFASVVAPVTSAMTALSADLVYVLKLAASVHAGVDEHTLVQQLSETPTTQSKTRIRRALSRLGWDSVYNGTASPEATVVETMLAPDLFSRNLTSLQKAGGVTNFFGAVARLQTQAFFQRVQRQPNRKPAAKTASEVNWADYDFFQRLTIVQNYPGVLAPLGLVFELEVPLTGDIPSKAAFEIVPPLPLQPDYAIGTRTVYEMVDARGEAYFYAAPRDPTSQFLGPPLPGAAASIFKDGLVTVGELDLFQLETLDHDAASNRLDLTLATHQDLALAEALVEPTEHLTPNGPEMTDAFARRLGLQAQSMTSDSMAASLGLGKGRLFKAVRARIDQLDPLTRFPPGYAIGRAVASVQGQDTPVFIRPQIDVDGTLLAVAFTLDAGSVADARKIAQPQPRRGRGFNLHCGDRALMVAAAKRREVAHEAYRVRNGFTVLDEEDILSGLAPEVRLAWGRPGHILRTHWFPLCSREEVYRLEGLARGPREVLAPIRPSVFRDFDCSPGEPEPPEEDSVSPTLFTWTGGLLSVTPSLATLRGKDDQRAKPEADAWVSLRAPEGSAPPAQFLDPDPELGLPRYEFRVRGIDRAGRAIDSFRPPAPENDVHVVGAPLLREEPLAPPRILMDHDVAVQIKQNTDSSAAVSANAWDRRSSDMLVVRAGQLRDARWVVPSGVGYEFCARYGRLGGVDGLRRAGTFFGAQVHPKTGDFPHLGDLNARGDIVSDGTVAGTSPPIYVAGGQASNLDTPYFPDPAAKSIAVEVRGEWETGVGIGSRNVILVPLYDEDADWPAAQPFRIVLRAADADLEPDSFAVDWNEDDRILRVDLAPGRIGKLRLSTVPAGSLDDLESLKPFGLNADFSGISKVSGAWERWTVAGGNPDLSPPLELTLVHAIEKPLSAPGVKAFHVLRNCTDLQLKARVNFDIRVDAGSTSDIELTAIWNDPTDDLAADRPDMTGPVKSLTADSLAVPDPAVPALDIDPLSLGPVRTPPRDIARLASAPTLDRTWSFLDSRHYLVRLTATAKSRFRDHFPPSVKSSFSRDATAGEYHVDNTAPPHPPQPTYTLPTFGWTQSELKQGGRRSCTSQRHGGGLRVYLDRGLYQSGVDERVGVLLLNPDSWKTNIIERVSHFVTQWGADPIHGDPGYDFSPVAANFLTGELVTQVYFPSSDHPPEDDPQTVRPDGNPRDDDWSTAWNPRETKPVMPLELMTSDGGPPIHASFSLIAFDPEFDPEVGKWFFDVVLDSGSEKYFPFIRMALVRYQPWSLYGAHLSKVLRLDYAQPSPDRALTVRRHPTLRRAMQAVVVGPSRRGSQGDATGVPENEVQVIVERRIPGRKMWEVDRTVTISPAVQPPNLPRDVKLLADVVLQFPKHSVGVRRIVVVEFEKHGDQSLYGSGVTGRPIHADVLELHHQLFWDFFWD